jgi:N-acetylglucosaminyldiphosphoundecaprenol N-acetyl-beta-D-mannosaminyltransferase
MCGLGIAPLDEAGLIDGILSALEEGRGGSLGTPNLEFVARYNGSPRFRWAMDQTQVLIADGMPLVWAARWAGSPLPGRLAGADVAPRLAIAAGRRGIGCFLIGGAPGTALLAAQSLTARGAKISGVDAGAFALPPSRPRLRDIASSIRASGARVVLVGMGAGKQELVMVLLARLLPGCWFVGVGGTFSFQAGRQVRAPGWAQGLGLEWAHRLVSEPRRLWRRYALIAAPAGLRLVAWALDARIKRLTRSAPGAAD